MGLSLGWALYDIRHKSTRMRRDFKKPYMATELWFNNDHKCLPAFLADGWTIVKADKKITKISR